MKNITKLSSILIFSTLIFVGVGCVNKGSFTERTKCQELGKAYYENEDRFEKNSLLVRGQSPTYGYSPSLDTCVYTNSITFFYEYNNKEIETSRYAIDLFTGLTIINTGAVTSDTPTPKWDKFLSKHMKEITIKYE